MRVKVYSVPHSFLTSLLTSLKTIGKSPLQLSEASILNGSGTASQEAVTSEGRLPTKVGFVVS